MLGLSPAVTAAREAAAPANSRIANFAITGFSLQGIERNDCAKLPAPGETNI
jgi:hypothetical protein